MRLWPLLLIFAAACDGCDDGAIDASHLDAGAPPGGLTHEQAKQVVAKVGDRTITLGDFAATLERMNQFDRLRYQTKERRRELLQELIDLELLAEEARRRGLDKKPEVQEAIRQTLEEAYLAKARLALPTAAEIPAAEVKAYYDANADKFTEPERRRAAAIVMIDREAAEAVLEKAKKGDGEAWGKLYHEHSIDRPKERNPRAPADLAGDLGIVGPVGNARYASDRVPEAVQKALFELTAVGDVHGELIEHDGKLYILRLSGMSKGHTRSLEEADRVIRQALLEKRQEELETKLLDDLRKRYPVEIDEEALKAVEIPKEAIDYVPSWEPKQPKPPGDHGHEGHDHEGHGH
jgi:peptidyl-prolyl cis-trans isomerase C